MIRKISMQTGLWMGAALLFAASAAAEPLVKMEGGVAKPGIVTAWSGAGKKVELTVAAGQDPGAIAASIEANVDRVKAKVTGGKITVIGKEQAELLEALAGVDFGGGDDLGALAAAAMGEEAADSGSSLRAKKTAELDKLFKDQKTTAMANVVSVSGGKFPEAVVELRIMRGPTGDLGKKIRKGQTIKVRPVFKKKGAEIDWSDPHTQSNLGAWFMEPKDRVQLKLGEEKGGVWEALVISR